MSDGELARLEVLRDLDQRRLTITAAAQLLELERRQVFRLLKAYRTEGPAGLISKRRGRPSNRRKPEAVRTKALALIRERYWDFGPTLAAEKLREVHGITLGRETLWLWMVEAGIWADRKQRRKQVHQPRHRRECVGELVQIDSCEHWWFEDRGPQCTLLVFVDDATSRLMHLQFVESESTFAYFHAARAYLEAWGKPAAFYSDKHGVFRVNHPGALGGDGMTQFGRALHALNIDIICANSSQAKGRVERAHKTLQDRLVKELRLAEARTLAEGNGLLPGFMADYNTRFAKPPASKKDLHRPLRPCDDLEDAFAWKEERTLSQALTLQYDKVIFILEPSDQAKAAIGKRVTVVDHPDGRLSVRYKGVDLPYRTFDKIRQVDQGAIADNKRLGPILAMIRDEQLRREPQHRSLKAPRRRDQREPRLFKLKTVKQLVAAFLSLLVMSPGHAMEITVTGEQLILSGPVITGDYDAVESRLSSQPQIKMIILRNSPGGDAPTGYQLGELFRQKSLGTAVSGYCYSSCSRLFLGGKERYFTDDYPPNYTQIGLHGHYDGKGDLNAASVNALHLKDWIIRFSDGRADEALVERWINIPRGTGLIHFYNPALVNIGGYSTFMCQGTEPSHPRIFDCERISKNALDLGIVTSLTLVQSHDQQQIRETILEIPLPSSFAAISDDTKLPGISELGRQEYRRFLAAPSPRAFAIAPSGHAWAWNSSLVPDAASRALARCAEGAREQCQLYAVDYAVVWTAPAK